MYRTCIRPYSISAADSTNSFCSSVNMSPAKIHTHSHKRGLNSKILQIKTRTQSHMHSHIYVDAHTHTHTHIYTLHGLKKWTSPAMMFIYGLQSNRKKKIFAITKSKVCSMIGPEFYYNNKKNVSIISHRCDLNLVKWTLHNKCSYKLNETQWHVSFTQNPP